MLTDTGDADQAGSATRDEATVEKTTRGSAAGIQRGGVRAGKKITTSTRSDNFCDQTTMKGRIWRGLAAAKEINRRKRTRENQPARLRMNQLT